MHYALQSVMNVSRTVFGKHKQGYLFPMLLFVKPMTDSFAGASDESEAR